MEGIPVRGRPKPVPASHPTSAAVRIGRPIHGAPKKHRHPCGGAARTSQQATRNGSYQTHLQKLATDEKQLVRDVDPTHLGRRYSAVSESGLYKLILRSDKPEAKQFQTWVTRDVLPAIRTSRVRRTSPPPPVNISAYPEA